MSLSSEAIGALRQVVLLDERVRNNSRDTERISIELADVRDRVARIEGMIAGLTAGQAPGSQGIKRRLPRASE